MGKLSGITVIDLSLFLPGPMMTRFMADEGARVIKVEPPAGDPARSLAPFVGGHSVWFANCNRGKESRTLDLKTGQGKDALWSLLAQADVFVEGFRPGAMQRLGFGAQAVRAAHPSLIYCSISAFGQDGSMADHPAHDMAVQALTGHLSMNDDSTGAPVVPGVPSADMAASLTALSAVTMALFDRERTGQGATVDCAMFDSLLPWVSHIAEDALTGGDAPPSRRQRSTGGAALYQVYATADGQHICLAGREPKFANVLLTGLGREDLLPVAQAPAGEQGELIEALAAIFAGKSRAAWEEWFAGKDIAFAPVLNLAEALRQPLVAERCLLTTGADGIPHIASPIRFDGEAPPLGAVPEQGR